MCFLPWNWKQINKKRREMATCIEDAGLIYIRHTKVFEDFSVTQSLIENKYNQAKRTSHFPSCNSCNTTTTRINCCLLFIPTPISCCLLLISTPMLSTLTVVIQFHVSELTCHQTHAHPFFLSSDRNAENKAPQNTFAAQSVSR